MVEDSDRPNWQSGLPQSFIPLNDDFFALSTRGQRLPSIMQTSRSTTSLFNLARRDTRRRSSFVNKDDDHSDDEENTAGANNWEGFSQSRTRLRVERGEMDPRRSYIGPEILQTPQIRSMRLIGYNNPRYKWARYYKTEEQLKKMRKPIRKYYERNNFLIAQYMYIDRLLDSSLPHSLIAEYELPQDHLPQITEEDRGSPSSSSSVGPTEGNGHAKQHRESTNVPAHVKRTPKNLYSLPTEESPLLGPQEHPDDADEDLPEIDYDYEGEGDLGSAKVVTFAIYLNLTANVILLGAKIAVAVLTSSLSVLASLVDAALDFLSTAIVWTTTLLISRQDQYSYPIGRRRLEPVGVLVFSIIMIISFIQVGLKSIYSLMGDDHTVVSLSLSSVLIMLSTVFIKGFCWFWCRLIKNSSVQALAQDAMTDVVFNTFSIIFPLVGYYANIWWLDALGGLLLSLYVIVNWTITSAEHVRNLCGAAASADERNILLYLTMRFAKTIRYIQGLQAYHAGDQLNVEVDIVLDEDMNLRDSHDLSESLQYVLESVPTVDRAFVHTDYKRENLPSHMNQQS